MQSVLHAQFLSVQIAPNRTRPTKSVVDSAPSPSTLEIFSMPCDHVSYKTFQNDIISFLYYPTGACGINLVRSRLSSHHMQSA